MMVKGISFAAKGGFTLFACTGFEVLTLGNEGETGTLLPSFATPLVGSDEDNGKVCALSVALALSIITLASEYTIMENNGRGCDNRGLGA
jgi:hypothetical protein